MRTLNDEHMEKLYEAGATEVLRQFAEIRRKNYGQFRHTFRCDRSREDLFIPLTRKTLQSVTLTADSWPVGKTLEETMAPAPEVEVDAIRRTGIRGESPEPETILREGDVLVFYSPPSEIERIDEHLTRGRRCTLRAP
ncbi:MAG TPA: hypothetical protein ENN01_01045 [Halothiobacillus sp.]|nr:hypothetical protein [Halothiobacillus sp.]